MSLHPHREMPSLEQPRESSAPAPCAKGCGFCGSPDTRNMCSVCFTKHLLATSTVAPPSAVETATGVDAAADAPAAAEEEEEALTPAELKHKEWVERCRAAVAEDYWGKRCGHCFKKLTLVGRFTCRCGKTLCPAHRLSETHVCVYDYQRAGRIAIRRSNPLVEGDKLRDRI